ncbi:MAG TPA: SIMPL domain-containing protein [Candidatus Kapabacteria bacterium]|nr:SIMPL domain-containing protein [Candidatus Kapabacteria bacterium]
MKKYILLLIFAFTVNVTGASNAQSALDRRITVSGDAEIKVVPDEVIISMAVQTNDMDIDKARSDNDTKTSAVLAMARRYGIAEKDLQTDFMSVEPKYDYNNNNREQKFLGYYITKNITVTLRDISKFDKFIAEALKLGTNFVQGIDFQISKLRQYQDSARIVAIRTAKEKATALAGEVGQKIGKPITITESNQNVYGPRLARNSMRYNNAGFSISEVSAVSSDGPAVAPGQLMVRASVSVVFEMEN